MSLQERCRAIVSDRSFLRNLSFFLDSCAPAWGASLPIIEKDHFQVFCQVSRRFDPITPLRLT